jgi:hypothetical protein
MGLLDTLISAFAQRKITDSASAQDFLESRAAYVAQKSISEYSQARANMLFSTLLGEKDFKAAYEEARWRAYPATLSMVSEVMAAAFRSRLGADAGQANRTAQRLAYRVIDKMNGNGPLTSDDWQAAKLALARDLSQAGLGAPHEAHAIARTRAKEVFAALPFHAAIKQHDLAMFSNTLSFHLAEIATELEEARLDPAVLADR